jgi:hypothetical protein
MILELTRKHGFHPVDDTLVEFKIAGSWQDGGRVVQFALYFHNDHRDRMPPERVKAVGGRGDQGEPVITDMLHHKD